MDFWELAKARFSCRRFSDTAVEDEKIEKLIETAIAAPTAKNLQPFHIWVVKSQEAISKVNETTKFGFGAKVMLVVGGKAEEGWVRPHDGRNFQDVDTAIAATHIMLAAESLGLGTTWVGYFDAQKLQELFPEMKNYDLTAIFPIGYPSAEPSERHFERKNKSELVSKL